MKYIKTYKLYENNITNKYFSSFTHAKIREVGNEIEKNADIKKYTEDYEAWYTNNWCFNSDPNKEFFCKYFFYFKNKKNQYEKLKKYLLNNKIYFDEKYELNNFIIEFDYTNQIIYKVIKDENPSFTDYDIKREINLLKITNKYNL